MPPKTPSELKEQIAKQNEVPATKGHDKTAEGLEIPRPTREQLFADLKKASKPDKG
jgi:hypothetical protein